MMTVNYQVQGANGATFNTTSYKTATENGNKIKNVFFTKVRSEEDDKVVNSLIEFWRKHKQ